MLILVFCALDRMQIALGEMIVSGVKTNGPLHQDLCADPKFHDGGVSIHYLEKKLGLWVMAPCGWPFRQRVEIVEQVLEDCGALAVSYRCRGQPSVQAASRPTCSGRAPGSSLARMMTPH